MSAQECEKRWRFALWIPWLGLVIMLAEIAAYYPQLPAIVASHFNAAGVANGWAPKQQFFSVVVPIAAMFLAIFTFLASRFPQISGLGWLVLVCEYWGAGLFVMLTHATLRYNLGQAKTLDFPIGIWSLIMLGALIIGEVGRIRNVHKRANADDGRFVAEERHASVTLGATFACFGAAMMSVPPFFGAAGAARTILLLVGVVVVLCGLWAYSGFAYRMTTAGLQIRTFGVPLRFIASADIDSVQARSCNPLTDFGGWGIRGLGTMRAYIWGGNRCVLIRTHSGEQVYLGTADAERLAREIESALPVHQV